MKLLIIVTLSLVLLTASLKKMSSLKSTDILAETDNAGIIPNHAAYAYNRARAGPGALPVQALQPDLFSPLTVPVLPEFVPPPRRGPVEVASEVASSKDYYDGSMKLNKIVVNCKINANPTDCVTKSYCGWCGSTNGCIFGNSIGPHEPCDKASYIFAAPYPTNAVTTTVDEHLGNLSMTVLAK